MKSELQDHKLSPLNPPRPISLFLLLATLMLTACNNQNDSTSDSDNVSIKIPDVASKLDQMAGDLTATIAVNGGTPQNMTVSATDATATLSNIPIGSTGFTIVFTYNLDPFGPLVVASATQTLDVTAGSNTLTFANADYDTASFDEDGDGLSNIVELDESSTTNPIVADAGVCVLGTSLIGSCVLGS